MKKAILFDLDGTLVDSLPDIAAAMNRSLTKAGLPTFPTKDYLMKVGNGVFKLTERSVGERTDLFDTVLRYYRADYAENCAVDSRPYPGIPEALEDFKSMGLKVCCLSNKDETDVKKVLGYCFPGFAFTVTRGRRDGVPLKPDPAAALSILEEIGVTAEEAVFVGDTLMDVSCGKNAGITSIGVTWGFRPGEDVLTYGADHIADSAEDLIRIVRELRERE